MKLKEELSNLEVKVSKGLKIAHIKMIELKKTPVVISSNGKIIEVQPKDMAKAT